LIGLGAAGLVGLAGGAAALVDVGVLPGSATLDRALGRCDAPAVRHALLGSPQAPIVGSFASRARRREVGFALSYPPGSATDARLPVCLLLHGYGQSAVGALDVGAYAALLAGFVRDGGRPFVLAVANGGDAYWHPHPDDDPLSMLIDEFLPLLAARGLRVDRLAVAGWSMGGYGALVAGLTYRDRFRAIVATSPAIFRSYSDARRVNAAAFDSASEWAAFDVTARAGEFTGLPLQATIGAADPFAPAVRKFRRRLPDPGVVRVETGCHDDEYWTSVAPRQIADIAAALHE
jgi:pimeloyl-ACP methyl ester carboxylesterase